MVPRALPTESTIKIVYQRFQITELWINGKLTDYAQAATKQHRIIPGCANSESEDAIADMVKPKASNLKKDSGLREVKDSAAQPQSYVRANLKKKKLLE